MPGAPAVATAPDGAGSAPAAGAGVAPNPDLQAMLKQAMMPGAGAAAAAAMTSIPPPSSAPSTEGMSRSVHVGNLGPNVDSEMLRTIFGCLGTITDCRIGANGALRPVRSALPHYPYPPLPSVREFPQEERRLVNKQVND